MRHWLYLISAYLICGLSLLSAQCNNEVQFPQAVLEPPADEGDVLVISNSQFAGDFCKVNDVQQGVSYEVNSSVATDYVTIRSSDNNQVLAHGLAPLIFVPAVSGPIAIHFNLSVPPCGEEALVRTTTMTHQGLFVKNGPVGVRTRNPIAALDVAGKVRVADDQYNEVEGMIRWNAETADFEGFDGVKWRSFTKVASEWGEHHVPMATESDRIVRIDDSYWRFADNIDMDQETVLVSANDSAFNHDGVAVIYQNINDTNTVIHELYEPTATPIGHFANGALKIKNNRAAVGTFSDFNVDDEDRGSVTIFNYSNDMWSTETVIVPDSFETKFGFRISLDTSYLAVSAGNYKDVYIYELVDGAWMLKQIVEDHAYDPSHFFAQEIQISQNRLFISAPYRPVENTIGLVYIYEQDENGDFTLQDSIISSASDSDINGFGRVFEVDGDHIVIGSHSQHYDDYDFPGFAAVYHFDGVTWQKDTVLVSPTKSAHSYFGERVAIDGDHLIVSGWYHRINSQVPKIYLYTKVGVRWELETEFIPTSNSNTGYFGSEIVIQKNTVVATDYSYDATDLERGALYIYRK